MEPENDRYPSVKIIVATHKEYRMPSDDMYLPLHVGAEGKKDPSGNDLDFGYTKDNTGDNISSLNPSFCELTGLYWAWKNINDDYIGLVQYRRYFKGKHNKKDPFSSILKYEDIKDYLGNIKIFVPKKRHYYIETLYSHYAHAHYAKHLDITKEIINEKYPEYLHCCKKVYKRRSGYMFNMMIMKRDLLDEYCTWVFDILFELKRRVSTVGLSAYQARLFGRVSEILFNIWLDYQLEIGHVNKAEIRELPVVYIGRVKWGKKVSAFLKAKFWGVKYKSSY